ncbi:MAG: Lrp/AsnC family transcriptional regulator [Planctomycetota bacterium]|jgi:hypothetical protein
MSIKAIVLSQCDPQHTRTVSSQLSPQSTTTLGRWDTLGVLEGESIPTLSQDVQERASKTTGVKRTETLPILRESNGKAPKGTKPTPKPVRAHLLVRTKPKRSDSVYEKFSSLPESQDVFSVAGRYDVIATVGADSMQEFTNFLSEKVNSIDGIDSLETAMIVD